MIFRAVLARNIRQAEGGRWRTPWVLNLFCLVAFLLPRSAQAHGELLIRIAGVTRQLATNATPQLYLQRGELYREDRNWEAAAADLDQVARLDPKLVDVDFCRAKLLVDEGQLEAAGRMYDKAIQRAPTNGLAFIGRARLLVRLGQRKAALSDFEKGISLIPEPEAEVYLDWAQTLAAEGQGTNALRRLDQGINKFGPTNTLQVYGVTLELQQGNTNAALARLETIIQGADRKERWLMQRGDIQTAAGRLTEAKQSYEAALAAMKLLPSVLQKSPPNVRLQTRINTSIAEVAARAGNTNAVPN